MKHSPPSCFNASNRPDIGAGGGVAPGLPRVPPGLLAGGGDGSILTVSVNEAADGTSGMKDARRVAVLVSGHGSNLEALLAAGPAHGLRVVLVVSDRPGVRAIEVAERAGIPAEVVDFAGYADDRAGFDLALRDRVARSSPDAVCLAGFMRILGPGFVKAFAGRIVNTHPSLLPAFRGAHAVRDALSYGVKLTGCTIHLVDEQVDHGPVLFQAAVEVLAGDDETSLHERIKAVEHRLLPQAVALVAGGRVRLDGRSTSISEPAPGGRA